MFIASAPRIIFDKCELANEPLENFFVQSIVMK